MNATCEPTERWLTLRGRLVSHRVHNERPTLAHAALHRPPPCGLYEGAIGDALRADEERRFGPTEFRQSRGGDERWPDAQRARQRAEEVASGDRFVVPDVVEPGRRRQ